MCWAPLCGLSCHYVPADDCGRPGDQLAQMEVPYHRDLAPQEALETEALFALAPEPRRETDEKINCEASQAVCILDYRGTKTYKEWQHKHGIL